MSQRASSGIVRGITEGLQRADEVRWHPNAASRMKFLRRVVITGFVVLVAIVLVASFVAASTSLPPVFIGRLLTALALFGFVSFAFGGLLLLASLYGGTVEEILLRLFVLTLIAWIAMKLARQERPSRASMWIAIVISAIVFGIAHLPITAGLTVLTVGVIAHAIVLNGLAGAVFGYLYWKRGLESAMIAHVSADLVLQVAIVLIG